MTTAASALKFYDERRKRAFTLGERYGSGGEADVFRLPDAPHLLAKIYKAQPSAETVRKLGHMVANPPEEPSVRLKHRSFAWPQELLVNQRDAVVGYVMPLAQGHTLLKVFNPHLRAQTGWRWNWRESHIVAYNLAATVGALHERNYVIGDVNESNVFVTPRSLITLLDTDSFQVTNGRTIYRCLVGKPEYTPPELQAKDFKTVTRAPEHDRFGLGVLIFQLLMEGNHPFRGRWLGAGEPKKLEDRIAEGLFPYDKSHRKLVLPPASAPPLEVLHPSVQALVKQCFIAGHVMNGARRPDPLEWMAALDEARSSLKPCKACGNFYSAHLKACPWCNGQKQSPSPRPMPTPLAAKPKLAPAPTPTPAPSPIVIGQKPIPRPQTPPPPQPQPPAPPVRATPPAPRERPGVTRSLLFIVMAVIGYILWSGGALESVNLGPLTPLSLSPSVGVTSFAAPCAAQPIVLRLDGTTIPWRVRFQVTGVVREANSIRLNVRLERTADPPNQWSANTLNDPIWLEGSDGQRYRLLGMGGFPVETISLKQGETHTGWFQFEQPKSDTFELVHPNIARRFVINTVAGACATQ
jgi:serine/threonine protein kinase